jgi:peroxiredoxin
MSLEVGQAAPDFRVRGPGGQFVTLSEYRGKKSVVLVFFPLAFSPVCSHQLPALQKDLPSFEQLGAQVLGISVDSHYANEAFARQMGLSFPLLSDLDHKVSQSYGVLRADAPISERAVFVVDRQGVVRYRYSSSNAGDMELVPRHEPILQVLRAIA